MTQERQYGSLNDGKFLLSEATRPSQVPYRCLLPEDLDNLLVPVCLSATHVGWGTLRLEPVWMHLGEVAPTPPCWPSAPAPPPARCRAAPAAPPGDHQVMITFYSDLDMATPEPWVPAVQFLAPGVLPDLRRPSARAPGRRHRARWSQLSGLDLHPGPTRAQAARPSTRPHRPRVTAAAVTSRSLRGPGPGGARPRRWPARRGRSSPGATPAGRGPPRSRAERIEPHPAGAGGTTALSAAPGGR